MIKQSVVVFLRNESWIEWRRRAVLSLVYQPEPGAMGAIIFAPLIAAPAFTSVRPALSAGVGALVAVALALNRHAGATQPVSPTGKIPHRAIATFAEEAAASMSKCSKA